MAKTYTQEELDAKCQEADRNARLEVSGLIASWAQTAWRWKCTDPGTLSRRLRMLAEVAADPDLGVLFAAPPSGD